ncbi:MAG: citramalate synthase [Planctomycetota bacterium]|nr:citramalate synthase [Planctomycetota bacterium]
MIKIYDTTLRDGTQGEGVSFSGRDKLKILRLLDEFSIDYVEGGWPGSNPKDIDFFKAAADLDLRHSKLAAFGSTCRAGSAPEDDANLKAILAVGTPVVTIFGKSWHLHVTEVLRTTPEENLRIIRDSVSYLVSEKREVVYDAEHFFDGYKADPEYALETLAAAREGGASSLVLCDTNGGSLPAEVAKTVRAAREKISDTEIGIHTHNDGGMADANTLTAVEEGANHIQGTFNGLGERCGNTDLTTVIPNLLLKMGRELSIDTDGLTNLTHLSRYIHSIGNLNFPENHPFVGQMAFAHKGGVHVNSVMKVADSYEHIDPEKVGNTRRILISELSGKSNMSYLAGAEGIDLEAHPDAARKAVEEIKSLENKGYVFEGAEASATLIILRHMGEETEFFDLVRYRSSVEHRRSGGTFNEATVKIKVKDQEFLAVGEGVGPIDALDEALRKAIQRFYPEVDTIILEDYKVRVIDAGGGAEAKVCVTIEAADREDETSWSTVGASENLIEASWAALKDSIVYGLLRKNKRG